MTKPLPGVAPRLAYSERDLDELGVLSRKTRYRWRLERRFPEPKCAGGRKLYLAEDVHRWLDDPEAWARTHAGKVS